jgi:hypothetical protein
MYQIGGIPPVALYQGVMPRLPDYAQVFGEVEAVDANHQIRWSPLAPLFVTETPDPKSSNLGLLMYISDIEPKSMNLTLTTGAQFFDNVYPYWVTSIDSNEIFRIPLTQVTKFYFSGGVQNVIVYHVWEQLGHPELFPFDQYDYTFDLFIPNYLNASNVSFNQVYLNQSNTIPDLIRLQSNSLATSVDESYWNVTSQVQFVGRNPNLGNRSYVSIDITLTRKPDLVNFDLLYPTLFLYLLLGLSVLLRGEDKVRNRLVLYLNVFVIDP